jgi:peroxiredoxin
MKKFFLLGLFIFLCPAIVRAQYAPIVTVDNVTIVHEQKGWRVQSLSAGRAHYNLVKNDLIVRIDGRNASETGPMQMASLFNMGLRRNANIFLERGSERLETQLRRILAMDYSPAGSNPFRHIATGFRSPDFELTGIDKRQVSLEQYKGKWLLIDFIATWCAPCMESFPKTLALAQRHHLNLLLIALDDKEPALQRLQRQYHIEFPIVMQHAMAPLPVAFGVTTNMWTGQIPALALIDPDGDVVLIGIGGDPQQTEIQIDTLIKLKTASTSK